MDASLTTLCYIRQGDRVLMLHRTRKKQDDNRGKWIGVGGKFEPGESPEECLLREVREETGLTLTSWQFRGLVTFISDVCRDSYMHLFTADGFTGDVVIDPDEKTSEAYRAFERRPNIGEETLAQLRTLPSRTRGGRAVKILAKIWKPSDLPLVLESGAEGVGLFRTESFYRNRTDFPTEDEQYRIYCSLAEQLGERPLTIRTATHDGRVRSLAEEMNPAMGVRGIRFSFENPELFRTQLRALLRAAADHNIAVTFPMVTSAGELRHARRALLRNLLFAYAQLSENPRREYDSFRTRVREQLQGEREWFSLLSPRNRVLAWMICRAPWSFRLAYRTYVAVFRREEQH